jgi:hypothetical protein
MSYSVSPAMQAAIETAVGMLVAGDYEGLGLLSRGKRLLSNEIRQAVADYGHQLVAPPSFDELRPSVIPVTASSPPRYSAAVDLWTADQGRSDLSLELTLVERSSGLFDIEVDNVHVL